MRLLRILKKLLIVVAVLGLSCVGYNMNWRRVHPAPFGRTTESVTERLTQALPRGTTYDSVEKFVTAHGLSLGGSPKDSVAQLWLWKVVPPLPFTSDIIVNFKFDAGHRLTGMVVEYHVNAL